MSERELVEAIFYRLRIKLDRPTVVTEGEEFSYTYTITNVGAKVFPGGYISVQVKWPLINEFVLQPLIIDAPLEVGQDRVFNRSQAPLSSGYTVFYINEAKAQGLNPIIVINSSGGQLWPPEPNYRMLFDAVRARTHEEITNVDIRETLRQNVEEMRILNKYSKRLDTLTIFLVLTTAWLFILDGLNIIFMLAKENVLPLQTYLNILFLMVTTTVGLIVVLFIAERRITANHSVVPSN